MWVIISVSFIPFYVKPLKVCFHSPFTFSRTVLCQSFSPLIINFFFTVQSFPSELIRALISQNLSREFTLRALSNTTNSFPPLASLKGSCQTHCLHFPSSHPLSQTSTCHQNYRNDVVIFWLWHPAGNSQFLSSSLWYHPLFSPPGTLVPRDLNNMTCFLLLFFLSLLCWFFLLILTLNFGLFQVKILVPIFLFICT